MKRLSFFFLPFFLFFSPLDSGLPSLSHLVFPFRWLASGGSRLYVYVYVLACRICHFLLRIRPYPKPHSPPKRTKFAIHTIVDQPLTPLSTLSHLSHGPIKASERSIDRSIDKPLPPSLFHMIYHHHRLCRPSYQLQCTSRVACVAVSLPLAIHLLIEGKKRR